MASSRSRTLSMWWVRLLLLKRTSCTLHINWLFIRFANNYLDPLQPHNRTEESHIIVLFLFKQISASFVVVPNAAQMNQRTINGTQWDQNLIAFQRTLDRSPSQGSGLVRFGSLFFLFVLRSVVECPANHWRTIRMNPNYPLLCSLWPLLGIDGGSFVVPSSCTGVQGGRTRTHTSFVVRRPFCRVGLLFSFAVVITDDGTVVWFPGD